MLGVHEIGAGSLSAHRRTSVVAILAHRCCSSSTDLWSASAITAFLAQWSSPQAQSSAWRPMTRARMDEGWSRVWSWRTP
jgi:hypothetical protein